MAAGFGPGPNEAACPCGSGGVYGACCGPLHRGQAQAATAEQLMRSRYSAFALEALDYLIATHPDPQQSAAQRRRDLRASCRQTRWLGLEIVAVDRGGPRDLEGSVCFEARFRAGGRIAVLRETSWFERCGRDPQGAWLYIKALESSG